MVPSPAQLHPDASLAASAADSRRYFPPNKSQSGTTRVFQQMEAPGWRSILRLGWQWTRNTIKARCVTMFVLFVFLCFEPFSSQDLGRWHVITHWPWWRSCQENKILLAPWQTSEGCHRKPIIPFQERVGNHTRKWISHFQIRVATLRLAFCYQDSANGGELP